MIGSPIYQQKISHPDYYAHSNYLSSISTIDATSSYLTPGLEMNPTLGNGARDGHRNRVVAARPGRRCGGYGLEQR